MSRNSRSVPSAKPVPASAPSDASAAIAKGPATGGDPATRVTQTPGEAAVAEVPSGEPDSPATRRDVPEGDQTETSHGGDAELEEDASLPPPKLGADDANADDTGISDLPIGVAGSPRTRRDIVDGGPLKPAEKKTGPDRPYRVVRLALPLVDMHGYARREFFLGAEDADTLRDIAAGLAAVGEKVDGGMVDRPEKALVWLLRQVREQAGAAADLKAREAAEDAESSGT